MWERRPRSTARGNNNALQCSQLSRACLSLRMRLPTETCSLSVIYRLVRLWLDYAMSYRALGVSGSMEAVGCRLVGSLTLLPALESV